MIIDKQVNNYWDELATVASDWQLFELKWY